MTRIDRHPYALSALGLAGTLAAASALAGAASPDTTGWTCTQCPFFEGYQGENDVGALAASGANANYGRYTGVDRSTAYVDAGADGQWHSEDGSYVNYELERLGLASRDGIVEGGRDGRYDLRLSYDGQPSDLYDTAVTPFRNNDGRLGLPSDWVAAGATSGMSALNSSLAPVNIGTQRSTVALLGQFFASPSWTIFSEFRRQEKNGTDLTSASFLTEAVQLAQPIDYITNSFNVGAAWAGSKASLRLTYTGSWFEDGNDSLGFANPYLPLVSGSTQGRLADPPGNTLQQFAATGNVQLPWFATTLTYSASLGSLRQNAPFLPVSTLPDATVPAPGSLDGDVRLSHYALGLASRPLPKLSLRGNATYDGRNDQTTPLAIAYVATDTFPGGTAVTPRYGEDRVRLDGGADYALLHWLRVGVGGQFLDVRYSPDQVFRHTQDVESWGRLAITPIENVSFTLKYGDGLRKSSALDVAALPAGENPLVLDYNYAPRDRVFSTLTGSWVVTPTITWALEGYLAKDDYRSSLLGLQASHEQRGSTTLTWLPRETLSAYLDIGYQRLYDAQNGFTDATTAPWVISDTQRYWNMSIGGQWVPSQRWALTVDYVHAPSYADTNSVLGGLAQGFPQNWTKLDSARLGVTYRWTPALQLHLRYEHESYNSNDWALDGVGPATVPNLLALGIQPYRDNVNLIGITARYQFAGASASKAP
ncbi:MAG: MtrB/PioB family decaheme-associated outer membrane protein [Steroidobacteraceae bacterium]|jgi:MtrB/PioB family decaheme-associated outer membrane protein